MDSSAALPFHQARVDLLRAKGDFRFRYAFTGHCEILLLGLSVGGFKEFLEVEVLDEVLAAA